ncbi:hypothetical protein HK104_003056 [Borealophlyctis nickersoniae]|nr:hypothetical protein HK104_003056 [Borealophlyctis nickersoniae]
MLTAEPGPAMASRKVALVTGSNSGIGYGVVQKLLEHFILAEEPITVVLACRNKARAEEARQKLIKEFFKTNQSEGEEAVQVLLVDLCHTSSVFKACDEFKRRFKRLDYLFLNAGIFPVERIDYVRGFVELFTAPKHLAKTGGTSVLVQRQGQVTAEGLGQVFAANVFGHYIMVKELEDKLAASGSGRVIWFSSTTASPTHFSEEDYQCLKGAHPYESSKRLGELVCMDMYDELRKRNIYSLMASPGNCNSSMFGTSLAWTLMLCTVLYIMRFMCLSGINISGKNGATAPIHLALTSGPEGLDPTKIYHSEINPLGKKWVVELSSDRDAEMAKRVRRELDQLYRKFKAASVESS